MITVTTHPIPAANHTSLTPEPRKKSRKLPLILTGVAIIIMGASCGVMATPKDAAAPGPTITQTVTPEPAAAATKAPSAKTPGADIMEAAYLKTVREQHPQTATWSDE